MNVLTTVIKSFIEKGRQIVKVLRYGEHDVQEAEQVAPFGIDSAPVKGMVAVFAETSVSGEPIVVGYMNEDALAQMGETRLFATNADGKLKTFIWLHNDGTMELGGKVDNAVRYMPLNQGLQNYNALIGTELAKIATAIGTLGGAYVVAPPTIDVSASKIIEIKTL